MNFVIKSTFNKVMTLPSLGDEDPQTVTLVFRVPGMLEKALEKKLKDDAKHCTRALGDEVKAMAPKPEDESSDEVNKVTRELDMKLCMMDIMHKSSMILASQRDETLTLALLDVKGPNKEKLQNEDGLLLSAPEAKALILHNATWADAAYKAYRDSFNAEKEKNSEPLSNTGSTAANEDQAQPTEPSSTKPDCSHPAPDAMLL